MVPSDRRPVDHSVTASACRCAQGLLASAVQALRLVCTLIAFTCVSAVFAGSILLVVASHWLLTLPTRVMAWLK